MSRASRIVVFAGLPLVFAAVVVVALTTGQDQASPKGTLAILFAIVGGFMFLVLLVQARDLRRSARDAAAPPDALAEAGVPVENPLTVEEARLWTSLAVRPIGEDAVAARERGWGMAKLSHRAAVLVTVLIFAIVPAAYLTERYELILVGAALIAGVAIYKALGVVGAGGELARGYESVGRAFEPLGLGVADTPTVGAGPRWGPAPGMKTEVSGALSLAGERHGRDVEVTLGGGRSRVHVRAATPEFTARSSDGKVKLRDEPRPPAVEAALREVPGSTDWKNLTVVGDPSGITVERKRVGADTGRLWMADLWLAEHLADAI